MEASADATELLPELDEQAARSIPAAAIERMFLIFMSLFALAPLWGSYFQSGTGIESGSVTT